MAWSKELKNKFISGEELKNHSTFKIGGVAKYFLRPDNIDDLRLALLESKKNKVQVKIIG